MTNYAGLKAEIAKPAYAGMTDAQIEAALTAPMTVAVDVPTGAVEGFFRSRLLMGGLQRFVANPPQGAPAELVEGISEFLGMVLSPHVSAVQMSDPSINATVTTVINAAAASGLLTTQQAADLLALGVRQTTLAETLGFTPGEIHDMGQELLAARRWE